MLAIIDVICFIILGALLGANRYFSRRLSRILKENKEANDKCELYQEEVRKLDKELNTKSIRNYYLKEENDKIAETLSGLTAELKQAQDTAQAAFENYVDLLDADYCEKETAYTEKLEQLNEEAIANYDSLIESLQEQWSEKINSLKELNRVIEAANETIRVAELDEKERSAYQIHISEEDLSDVKKLLTLCSDFKNPRAWRMVIWQTFFQKETNNLCARIKVNNVTGIYKITNILNNKVYIGQSKDISSRFKQHIKCGLGIDTPVTNSLYKAMMKDGVWNFTFELLEECQLEKLNECERKWIALFESDTYGYNGNKGISK